MMLVFGGRKYGKFGFGWERMETGDKLGLSWERDSWKLWNVGRFGNPAGISPEEEGMNS